MKQIIVWVKTNDVVDPYEPYDFDTTQEALDFILGSHEEVILTKKLNIRFTNADWDNEQAA